MEITHADGIHGKGNRGGKSHRDNVQPHRGSKSPNEHSPMEVDEEDYSDHTPMECDEGHDMEVDILPHRGSVGSSKDDYVHAPMEVDGGNEPLCREAAVKVAL